ncbi:MAG: glycosyltransferase family 4 protein [Gemmatimonadota bacterium]|nr:glycosyltransferase family 4 protein [Gemmatimonadota bacterium]MDP6803663.1 glycosyltransferase family 4 protein [Gemmatimonadota bacterium]MDP7031721.1 glycosyltransferase family 4 protein [Gemmatimonadota bacterium]
MSPHRNILLVNWNDRTNPFAGGAEVHLHETFARLAARGHRVMVLCSGYAGAPAREVLDGMEILRVSGRYGFNFAVPAALRRLRREFAPSIVVEALNKIPLCTPVFAGAPVLGIGHHLFGGTIFREIPPPLSLYVFASEMALPWIYRRTMMEVISESTREDFILRGLAPDRVRVVHVGVDRSLYRPPDAEQNGKPFLLAMGRVRRYKRLDLVIDAVDALARSGQADLTLTIAGGGNYLDSLRRHARRTGADARVRFLGSVSEEEKIRLYQEAVALVMTSPKEGWGLTCLEAQACGTPVIASNSPGLREAVRDGESGILVPHGDRAALEAAMSRMLGEEELRRRLAEGALRFADTFSWDRTADSTMEMIEEAIAEWEAPCVH